MIICSRVGIMLHYEAVWCMYCARRPSCRLQYMQAGCEVSAPWHPNISNSWQERRILLCPLPSLARHGDVLGAETDFLGAETRVGVLLEVLGGSPIPSISHTMLHTKYVVSL